MNRYPSAFILTAPMAVVVPHVAAQFHPAQVQAQQDTDTILKVVHDGSLSEQQRIRRIENYVNRCLGYKCISALVVGAP